MKNILLLLFVPLFIFGQNDENLKLERMLDSAQNPIKYLKGEESPSFVHSSFNGKEYSSNSFKGKITFVNFWFSNCSPCLAEMQSLNELYLQFKSNPDFQFLSFTFDNSQLISKAIEKYKLNFDIISISDPECRRLNFNKGFPTNIIYDRNGKMIFMRVGGQTDIVKVKEYFQSTVIPVITEQLNK